MGFINVFRGDVGLGEKGWREPIFAGNEPIVVA